MLVRGKSIVLIILLFIPFIILPNDIGMIFGFDDSMGIEGINDDYTESPKGHPFTSTPLFNENHNTKFIPSESDFTGVLNPVSVEQRGYYASGNISARTDTESNTGTELILDYEHNWIADEAEVSVWNLEKLYAVNGSYDEGTPGTNVFPSGEVSYHPVGWDANSTDTTTYDDDVQLAAYDSSGRQYISVENQGGKVGQNAFGHVAGTKIAWVQEIDNTPYTENFILSFDYFYLRGPIDGVTGEDPVIGNCSIALFIDGANIWNMSLLLLSQRGVWFETGEIPITVSGAPSTMLFEIGLIIDETLILDKRYDYDGDSGNLPDGIDNAAYITVYMDDISFIKSVPPTPEEVELEFTTGGVSSAITGSSGYYNATITNSSYWVASPIPVEVTSNTSISFSYKARLLSHRFTASNWRTYISDLGVLYSVQHDNSPSLTFYSYVGYLGGYEEPEMIIRFPADWENSTISDPFLTDLTPLCTIMTGNISVPSSILNRLGWWQFELESPNYGQSIEIQKYYSSTGWTTEMDYRVGNNTRPSIRIASMSETPSSLSNVNISWYLPNGTLWYYESLSGGIDGSINGTSKILDNSLAGKWQIDYIWSNGTEVACQAGYFDVYHSSSLTALDDLIDTDVGEIITGRVRFLDADNGDYLMEDAIIKANWSESTLFFDPNPTRNWWEVDLDTSTLGAGLFLVQVDASLPYFDTAFCEFSVIATNVTRLTSPNSPWTSAEWEDMATLTFNYQRYDSVGSSWVPITNTSLNVIANINWTAGAWSVSETAIDGIYEMNINTAVKPVGDYLLNISFSKPAHQTKQLVLTLFVTPQISSLNIYNGSSAQRDIEDTFNLKMNYTDAGGDYIGAATISVDEVSPSSGLSLSSVDPVSGEFGNYSLSIIISSIGVYTIRFLAEKDGYQSATGVFILVVNDVPTNFTVTSSEAGESELFAPYIATYHFEMYNGSPIEGAVLNVVYSGPTGGLSWLDPQNEGSGNYSIQFEATVSGAYLITVAASKQYYQSDSISFFLSVSEIGTSLVVLNGTADTIDFGETYRLVLSYANTTPYGLPGADVEIVSIDPSSGLNTSTMIDEDDGIYSLILDPFAVGIYTLILRVNLTNHETQFASFTLSINDIITDLTITSGNSAEIGLLDTFEAKVHYEMFNATGIQSADITIFYSGPAGLSWTEPSDDGSGNYSSVFSATTSGTYLITITASKVDHQAASSYFFLLVGDITTHLDVLNGTASTIEFGETYRLVLSYHNNSYFGLEGANVSVISITPSSGLTAGSIVDEGSGIYSVILEPQLDDTFTLLFRANLTNHQTQFATFTLVSNPVSTELKVLNSTTSLKVGGNFTLYLRFETGSEGGIEGASLTLLTTPTGLVLSEFEDAGNGYYLLYIFPTHTGSYQVSLSASKQFYQTESASVFIVVGEKESQFMILNGSTGNIVFGDAFKVVMEFSNASDYGLEGAVLSFASISPSGIPEVSFSDEGEGIYSVTLAPTKANTYSLLIRANLTDYEIKFASFTLVVEPVSSILKLMNSTASISVDMNYNLTLRYEAEDGTGISGASIESLNVPEGITVSMATDISDGYYVVNLDPSITGVFNILLKASKENHQNVSISYTIEAILIPTSLEFLNDISSAVVDYGEKAIISIYYERTDTMRNISDAQIEVTTGAEDIVISIKKLEFGYEIDISPYEIGVHVISIIAQKNDHRSAISTFTLTVEEIETSLEADEFPEELYFNRGYSATFAYHIISNSSIVVNPTISVSGSKSSWVSISHLTSGACNISILPDEIGTYSLMLTFSAAGMEPQTATISFTVVSIGVDAILIGPFTSLEYQLITITIDLVERGSNTPVTGADLQCRLNLPDAQWVVMTETDSGRYLGEMQLPYIDVTTNVDLLVFMNKDNYQLSLTQVLTLYIEDDPIITMTPILTFSGSSFGVLLLALIALRVSRTRKRKRNLKAIAIKQRFDDVKNMIGIIVLHKKSGLPLYSKTLKGGFDESMVSAFITAVSSFRSEFGMDEKHWDFQVIPISDIISAVPTRNLICAFITGSTPSKEQLVKMEAFGRAIGAMFDESQVIAPTEVLDERQTTIFTSLFMDMMDGEFLTAYKKREAVKIPRHMSCLSSVVGNMEDDEFTLDELARGMAMCGIEEGEAYLQVMDAIENDLIHPANGSKPIGSLEPTSSTSDPEE